MRIFNESRTNYRGLPSRDAPFNKLRRGEVPDPVDRLRYNFFAEQTA
jgi:hypothetical protein